MRAALHAEWTKLITVPIYYPALIVLLTVGLSVTASVFGGEDPVQVSLLGVQLGQAVVAAWAVQLLAGEFGTGLALATFTALPRRLTVLAAKTALLLTGVLGAALLSVGASVLAGRALIGDYPALSSGPLLRAAGGAVLYLLAIALLGLGVAAVLRSPVAATGTILGLLYLAPVIIDFFHNPDWQRAIFRSMPSTAGLTVLSTVDLASLPVQPWPGLGVAATWAFVTFGIGAAVICARDV
ncbi:ABC-2 type transport system permease protein [Actinoplanes tereljensis]|uniref:ABC transporter n=1 Tax=Paractinoplanes tereljensis TaxID=571912 RepID=A0A919NNA1_9ACTN|nr:ABC transporter permease [Actinoplanes tereljensis]GIF21955.1 ABC transporter [Actinoplanes tereljensis]